MLEGISTFSKVIIGVISSVAVAGAVTAGVTLAAEKDINTIKKAEYEPKSMQAQRGSMTEGLYWELEDIVTMSDSVETGRCTLITEIMQRLPEYGASYYYSFKDNAVLGLLPLDDPSYAIDLWQQNVSNEFAIIRDMLPFLKDEYSEYKTEKEEGKVSDGFKSLCASVGIPFPSIAVTSYEWFEYKGPGTSMPTDSNLKIAYVDTERMDLSYGDRAVLHYVRIKKLPQEIAPITMYFKEKAFFFNNHDKLESTSWTPSDQEIDAHFRKTFKSRKY